MYELTIERDFSAAHQMRGYPGACARMHGHNYCVKLTIEGDQLDDTGILMDFAELKRIVDAILEELDHRCLNDLPPFNEVNPSSENLARYIYRRAADRITGHVRLVRVEVAESPTSSVTYREE